MEDRTGPCAIRYPKGAESEEIRQLEQPYETGKAQVLVEGKDISILCEGSMVAEGLKAVRRLKEWGVSAELINLRYLKPLDMDTIYASLKKNKRGVVMENATRYGSVHSALCGYTDVPLYSVSVPDCYVPQGKVSELFELLGMDGESVAQKIMEEFFR